VGRGAAALLLPRRSLRRQSATRPRRSEAKDGDRTRAQNAMAGAKSGRHDQRLLSLREIAGGVKSGQPKGRKDRMPIELDNGPIDIESLAETYADLKERCDDLEAIVDRHARTMAAYTKSP
jgi:hypothetical protein